MAIKAANQITITDITDAYSVFMDSESYTYMATTAGAISGNCVTNIKALCGTDNVVVDVTVANIKFYDSTGTQITSNIPFTATKTNSSDNKTVTIQFAAASGATLSSPVEAVIPVEVDSGGTITIDKRFTISAAKAGTNGTNGTNGAKWYQGSGVPSSGTGANGDYYLNTANGDVYTKSNGSWAQSGNIKGANGTNGTNGADGSKWYSGTGITGTSTTPQIFSGSGVTSAAVNDQYLNTSTGNTYICTLAGDASTAKWKYTGNIKGATGSAGADAILLEISANGPTVFKKNTDNVKLTPIVRVGGTAQTITAASGGATCTISGTTYYIRWFDGSTELTKANTADEKVAEKSGSNYTGNLTLYGKYITNAALIECRLDTTAAS